MFNQYININIPEQKYSTYNFLILFVLRKRENFYKN